MPVAKRPSPVTARLTVRRVVFPGSPSASRALAWAQAPRRHAPAPAPRGGRHGSRHAARRRPANLYSETDAGKMSPAVAGDLPRVYVPHVQSNDVYVIDPATFKVVDKFKVGLNPQHVVPSWDLQTLWVANNAESTHRRQPDPIDPKTGKPGKAIPVDDPYNMYFSPDGKSAIVVAEARKRLDFRDPKTMAAAVRRSTAALRRHQPRGLLDRRPLRDLHLRVRGHLAKIDLVDRKVLGYTQVIQPGGRPRSSRDRTAGTKSICTTWKGMPQDIRVSPDGKLFFVADMMADGVFVVDGEASRRSASSRPARARTGSIRAATARSSTSPTAARTRSTAPPKGKGSVSVVDFATRKVEANWPIPGGGSPDMGNVSADGKTLWLSGRYDHVVYVFDTTSGAVQDIGRQRAARPHGVAAAGPLLARPHRQHALAASLRRRGALCEARGSRRRTIAIATAADARPFT